MTLQESSVTKAVVLQGSLGVATEVLVRVACLTSLLTLSTAQTTCPSLCSCSVISSGRQAVTCGPGLAGFPQGLPVDTESISFNPLPWQTPNSIPSLSAIDVDPFVELKWIKIRRSNVQRIGPSALNSLTKLLGLDLRDNKLQRLSRSDLAGLSSLVTLDISDNRGCLLDSDTFRDLSRIHILRLANIGLDMLGDLLNGLTTLNHLDLHGNNLFRIRGSSLVNLNSLRHLDLSGNDLYGVDEDTSPVLSSLTALDLDYNPWRCNCALTWVKSLPKKFVAPSGGGRMPLVCGQPARLAYQDVWGVQDPQMICSERRFSPALAQPPCGKATKSA